MNVKKGILLALLGLPAVLGAACSGAAARTPTRTPRAVAENGNPTQTPWIIFMSVTSTPEPFTVTPLPTVTSPATPKPTAAPTKTRAKATAAPKPVAVASSPTSVPPPAATAAPACGPYTISALTFPENGATRNTKKNPSANMTIEFKFNPVTSGTLDPKIGYQVLVRNIKTGNGAVRYISHNGYLDARKVILDQFAVYGLSAGDDSNLTWNVTPIMASGGFDDQNFVMNGTSTECGPAAGPFSIVLAVLQ